MKEHLMKKLLALLVAICMLLGSVAALADVTVTVTPDAENPQDVTVDVNGKIEGESWTGVKEAIEGLMDENGELVDPPENVAYVQVLPDSEGEPEIDNGAIADAEMLTVNAGDIDVQSEGGSWQAGFEAKAQWDNTQVVGTSGDITTTFTDPVSEDPWEDEEGNLHYNAESRGANAAAYGEGAVSNLTVEGDINSNLSVGENSNVNGAWNVGAKSEASGEGSIATLGVEGSVVAETTANRGEEEWAEIGAYGAGAEASDGAQATVQVEGKEITATATNESGYAEATGAYAMTSWPDEYSSTGGTAIGTFDVDKIEVKATATEADANGVDSGAHRDDSTSEVIVNGADISAEVEIDGMRGGASGARVGADNGGSASLVMNGGSASGKSTYDSPFTEETVPENEWDYGNTGAHGVGVSAMGDSQAHAEINDAKLSAEVVSNGVGINADVAGLQLEADDGKESNATAAIENTDIQATITATDRGGASGINAMTNDTGSGAAFTMNGGSASAEAILHSDAQEPPMDEEQNKYINARGVDMNALNGGVVQGTISNAEISATTDVTGEDTWSDANGLVINAESQIDDDGKAIEGTAGSASVTVDNTKISATVENRGNASGLNVSARNGGSSQAEISGSQITAQAKGGKDTWADVNAVDVRAENWSDAGETEASVRIENTKINGTIAGQGNINGVHEETHEKNSVAKTELINSDIAVKTNGGNDANGIHIYADSESEASMNVKGGSVDVQGVTRNLRGVEISSEDGGAVRLTADGTDVTVTQTGDYEDSMVRGVGVYSDGGNSDADWTGNVTVTAEKGKVADRVDLMGVEVNSNSSKEANAQLWLTGDVKAINENEIAVNEEGWVNSNMTGAAVGVGQGSAFLGVIGNITAVNVCGWTNGLGVWNGEGNDGGDAQVYVDGSVSIDVGGGGGQALDVFTGSEDAQTRIVVLGDALTKGGDDSFHRALQVSAAGKTDILIDGTLSSDGLTPIWIDEGSETRQYMRWVEDEDGEGHDEPYEKAYTYSADNVNLYAWQILPDEESGNIANVWDIDKDQQGEDPYDEEASKAFEARIWYIVKIQEAFGSFLTAKGTGDDNTFGVESAHEGENVTVGVDIDETVYRFDGIYYNDETAAEYTTNADGTYSVKMLRGGAMMLGLNLHKHETTTRKENVVPATCTADGSYDLVYHCDDCNKDVKTEHKTTKALGHDYKGVVTAPTCTEKGYTTYTCSRCNGSYKAEETEALGHKPAEAVKENVVKATANARGSYDVVVYCSVCGAEISRDKKHTPKLEEPMPALKVEFVYDPVSDDTEVNGVKASDKLPAAQTLEKVGETLDGEGASVRILNIEKVLDADEMKRLEQLPLNEQMLVALGALGFADGLGESANALSDDAKALSDDIAARLGDKDEAGKKALQDAIAESFPKQKVTVDGQSRDSFSLDLEISRGGEKAFDRYTFYDKDGEWTLYQIAKGVYREVKA